MGWSDGIKDKDGDPYSPLLVQAKRKGLIPSEHYKPEPFVADLFFTAMAIAFLLLSIAGALLSLLLF
jgi:hypothetical protein